MRRRDFVIGLGGTAMVWPRAASAQRPGGMRRLGILLGGAATEERPRSYLAAFTQALGSLGWTDGQNLHIEVRWNDNDAMLARIYAAQLIGLMPDVILANQTINLAVLQRATSTIPIVFVSVADPVTQGFVRSMRQPGGNLTGFSLLEFSLGGKWIDLLKEVVPGLARVAFMFNPDTDLYARYFMQAIETAAPSFGVEAMPAPVRTPVEIEKALTTFAHAQGDGLITLTGGFAPDQVALIADIARRQGVPAIAGGGDFTKGGGLMEYGPAFDLASHFRQAAGYVDRIFKGEKPGDLPVQAPDRYRFVVNLKTAKMLGLTVPLPLLGFADEVIE